MRLILVLSAMVVLSASEHEKTLCGLKLASRLREMCTPYDQNQPCYRVPDLEEKSVHEKLQEIYSRYKRSSGHHHHHHTSKYMKLASELCCNKACDPASILSKFCCKQAEARMFYKHLQELQEGRSWARIF